SGDPVWTSNRYGVQALRTPVFRSGRQEIGDPAQWLGDEISKAVRDSDGVVISGGGNLCQTWPEKILERVVLIQYARELGRPVVVVGQPLSPDLEVHQRRLLEDDVRCAMSM